MSQEPATSEELLSALERTLGCGSARIEFRFWTVLPDDFGSDPRPMRSRGVSLRRRLTRRVGPVCFQVLTWGMRRLLARLTKTLTEGVSGVIDFEAHRCAFLDDPGRPEAELIVGDQHWHGAPGTNLDGLSARPASVLQPLWLVDLVRGIVDAREVADGLDGAARRFSAHADLNRSADAVSYEMAVPSDIAQLGELKHISVEVWVDADGYIRRIRHTSGGPGTAISTSTLDLTELGITLPSDWSRIPALPTAHLGQ